MIKLLMIMFSVKKNRILGFPNKAAFIRLSKFADHHGFHAVNVFTVTGLNMSLMGVSMKYSII